MSWIEQQSWQCKHIPYCTVCIYYLNLHFTLFAASLHSLIEVFIDSSCHNL
jgi:hypothetical protein